MPPLSKDEFYKALSMDPKDCTLRYDETPPGSSQKSKYKYFDKEVQGFIYYVYMENCDDLEVLDQVHAFMGNRTSTISVKLLQAVIQFIFDAIQDISSTPQEEQEHWTYVANYALSTGQIAVGVDALLKRVGHSLEYNNAIFVRCYHSSGRPNASFDQSKYISFDREAQSFFYNGIEFAKLTSEDTARAYISLTKKPKKDMKNLYPLRVSRYIRYLRTGVRPGGIEAEHLDRVTERNEGILAQIRLHAPAGAIPSSSAGIAVQSLSKSSSAGTQRTAAPEGNPKVVRTTPDSGRSRSPENPSTSAATKDYRRRDDGRNRSAVAGSGLTGFVPREPGEQGPQYGDDGREIGDREERERQNKINAEIARDVEQMDRDRAQRRGDRLEKESSGKGP